MDGYVIGDVKTPAYIYRAVALSVYDGDTMTLDIDVGFGVWLHKQKVRLWGIDTPEMRGEERPEGIIARDFVRGIVPAGKPLLIQTRRDKTGKYGRWLAEVFVEVGDVMISLNESLVARGLAKRALY